MMQLEITDWISVSHQLQALREDHPCAGLHGHEMEVTIKVTGQKKPEGWILPFESLAAMWEEHCRSLLDHSLLNKMIDKPTCENVAEWIAKRLHPRLQDLDVNLVEVSVGEMLHNRMRAKATWSPWCEDWASP